MAAIQRPDWCHDTQMAFERADLAEDDAFFAKNWNAHKKMMRLHSLGSFGCFQWEGFRAWLRKSEVQEKYPGTKDLLDTFKKHPAWGMMN